MEMSDCADALDFFFNLNHEALVDSSSICCLRVQVYKVHLASRNGK